MVEIGKFKPEYVSKMEFYLEGLNRQVKKLQELANIPQIEDKGED